MKSLWRLFRRVWCGMKGHPSHAREPTSMLFSECECGNCGARWIDDNF